MIKKLLIAASLFCSLPAFGAADFEQVEICVYRGPCALKVYAEDLDVALHVVKSRPAYDLLASYWKNAVFFIASEEEYNRLREYLPEDPLMLPAGVPGQISAGGRPSGTPQPAPGAKGPLISGSINVTVTGGNSCEPCHGSNMKEIHKDALKGTGDDPKGK